MIAKWKDQLDNSTKCLFYKNYKANIVREPFIAQLPERFAIALVKFHCNNHKLPIEQFANKAYPEKKDYVESVI